MDNSFFTRASLGSVIGSCKVCDEVSRVFSTSGSTSSCFHSGYPFDGARHHVVSYLDDPHVCIFCLYGVYSIPSY